jgi:hypothetical protein
MMRPDLRNRLLAIARGDVVPERGVTAVTTSPPYGANPLQLRQLRALHHEKQYGGVGESDTVTAIADHLDIDDAIEERLAIIDDDGTVASIFREAWARLNCECPAAIASSRWINALIAGGILLDVWGGRLSELAWRPDNLFAPEFGLVWRLADFDGAVVTAVDREGAIICTREGARRRYQRRWVQ